MDLLKDHGIGGGTTTNNAQLDAIIDSYVVSADGNLNAGDLCEFINGQIRKTRYISSASVNTVVSNTAAVYISAVTLSTSQVLVAYSGTSNYLVAALLTISGSSITRSSAYTVDSHSTSYITAIALSPTSAIVTYNISSTSINSVIITISGTTITPGTIVTLDSGTIGYASATLLSANQLLVGYTSTNSYSCAAVITISGTTITKGATSTVATVSSSCISLCTLNSSKVLFIYCNGSSSNCLYSVILTIAGTTITSGIPTQTSYSSATYSATTLINSNTVLLNYTPSNNPSPGILLTLLTINETSITVGNASYINGAGTGNFILLDQFHVLFIFPNYSSSYIYAVMLKINSNTIGIGTFVQINNIASSYIASTLLDSMHVLISYQYTSSPSLDSIIISVDVFFNISLTAIINAKQPYVVCPIATTSGSTVKGILKGTVAGLSNLVPNNTYYCDDSGNLTTTQTRPGEKAVGVALSATDLLINKGFWER